MSLMITAILFGSACAVDGCILSAALAAAALGRSALRWSLLFGLAHIALMLAGAVVLGGFHNLSEAAAAGLTLLGATFLFCHTLRLTVHSEIASGQGSEHCCAGSHSRSSPRSSSSTFASDAFFAATMSSDALVSGVALRSIFRDTSWAQFAFSCILSGVVTGLLVYGAVRGARLAFESPRIVWLRQICLCAIAALLGVVWLSAFADLISSLFEMDIDSGRYAVVALGILLGLSLKRFFARQSHTRPSEPHSIQQHHDSITPMPCSGSQAR